MPSSENAANQTTENDAIYYPYIHIRSIDWLKRALLVFPHVARILPRYFRAGDSDEIRKFADTLGRWDMPLLRSADIQTEGVREAQRKLLGLLSNDLESIPDFKKRFGKPNLLRRMRTSEFILHKDKPIYELVQFMEANGLMWRAEFQDISGFTAVHPTLGEAIMSTIAMACAQDEGFDVVTDDGRMHRNIIEADVRGLYRSLVHGNVSPRNADRDAAHKLCELLIFNNAMLLN